MKNPTSIELYSKLLEICDPWQVTNVEQDRQSKQIHVFIEYHDKGKGIPCPVCGRVCTIHDHRIRRLRHLDTCDYQTILEVNVPRVECEEHKVEQLPLSFAEKNSRYTVLFEAFVLEWLKSSPVSAVSKSFRLGWDATDGIMQRAVERGVSRRKTSTPQAIGIEETSGSKGRKYITIIPDKDQDCVIEVVEDRKAETPENWLKTREICDLSGVKSVSMDMWDPYIKAVKACRADAEKKIGFERFHGAQHFNRTPDKVRAGEHREQQKLTGTSPLTRSRFGWFEEFGAYGQSQQQEKRVFEVIAFESGNRPGVEDKRACGQSVGLCVDGSSRGGMEEAVVVDKSLPHCGDHPGGEDDTKLSLGDTQCDTVTDNQQHAGS